MLLKPFERYFHAVQTGLKPFEPVWNGVRIGLKLLERILNDVQLALKQFERISNGLKIPFQRDFRNGSDPATAPRKSRRSVHLLELGHYPGLRQFVSIAFFFCIRTIWSTTRRQSIHYLNSPKPNAFGRAVNAMSPRVSVSRTPSCADPGARIRTATRRRGKSADVNV